jgi:peptidoglycan/LPS O-acetylase OafA/YrhL
VARLRPFDWATGILAVGLAVAMFLPFQGADRATGWASVGWLAVVLVALAIAGGAATWLTIALRRSVSVQIVVVTGAAVAAAVATIVVVVEALSADEGCYGRWVVSLVAALLTIASWRSMGDERTDAPSSAYTPPPPRPAPPQ